MNTNIHDLADAALKSIAAVSITEEAKANYAAALATYTTTFHAARAARDAFDAARIAYATAIAAYPKHP